MRLRNYVRRYRMEFDLCRTPLPEPQLPDDYFFLPWSAGLLERHAAVKFAAFQGEIDAFLFPLLGQAKGCRRLMQEIAGHVSFLPSATWLISFRGDEQWGLPPADCATIQGVVKPRRTGSIQNVGVVPEHRGSGLGRMLVLQALRGFRGAGLQRVYLEVTAENEPAVNLYRSLGFEIRRTMYQDAGEDVEPVMRRKQRKVRSEERKAPSVAVAIR